MFAFALLLSAVLPAAFALPANNSAPYGYNIHPNGNKNKCVDLRGDVQSDGTLVQMYVEFLFNSLSSFAHLF